jgi:nucleoside-diphosphate-sugar epimerase
MTRILIIGASGYIGSALAASLRGSGHQVYGLTRHKNVAQTLATREIIPVIGSAQESDMYLGAIQTNCIEVVIDASSAKQDSAKVFSDVRSLSEKKIRQYGTAPKLGYIYVSGMWVHGHTPRRTVSDTDPVGTEGAAAAPAELVAWRTDLEHDILKARSVLNAVIVRPSLTYGRQSSIWSIFLLPVLTAARQKSSSVAVSIDPNSHVGLIHVDDLVRGIHLTVDKLPFLHSSEIYPVFNFCTSIEKLTDIVEAAAIAYAYDGEMQFTAPDNAFTRAMNTSIGGADCSRAKQILGWYPQRLEGCVRGMDVYATAFEASKSTLS